MAHFLSDTDRKRRPGSIVPGAAHPLPLTLSRDVSFEPTDVQALGQTEADEFRTFAAKSLAERNLILDRDYDKTLRLANVARAFGANVSVPQRRASGSTADPAKGIAKSAANRLFMQNLLKKIKEVGKLEDMEVLDFLESQNAGPEQLDILSKMEPYVDIGDMVTLYRYNPTTNKLEYLFRYPSQISPEIRERGWKDKIDELKYQRQLGIDEAAQKKIDRITEIQTLITALEPSKPEGYVSGEDITWIPQTEEEYQRLKQQWGIKLPEAEALLRQQIGVAEPGKVSTYAYTNESGKQTILNLTPRQYTDALRSKKYKGLATYDIYGKELTAAQNDMISNLMAGESQRIANTELDEQMVKPLTKLQFQQLALKKWTATGRPIGDIERFHKQTAAAFMGAEKTLERYNTDLSILMNQISTITGWDDFAEKSKGMENEAVIKAAEELQRRYGSLWDYTGPRIVFNRAGNRIAVDSYDALLKQRNAGYQYDKYNNAPDRPVHKVSDRYWIDPPPPGDIAVVNVQVTGMGETGLQLIRVYTPQGRKNKVDATRNDISQSVSDFEEFTNRVNMIIAQLKEGQPGTDLQAIRDLEKLKDESGVIRESDVQLIKESIGTIGDAISRWTAKLTGGRDRYLTKNERDQVANAALTTLMVLQASMRANINRYKLEYANEDTFTWVSKGRDLIDFYEVVNEEQYKKYMERRKKKDYWTFQSDFITPTVTGDRTLKVLSADDAALKALTSPTTVP